MPATGRGREGIAAELARLRQHVRRLEALYDSAHLINSSLAPEEIIRRVVAIIDRHFTRSFCAVLLVDDARPRELVVAAASSRYPSDLVGRSIPVTTGISGRAFRQGRPVLVDDVRRDPDYIPGIPDCRAQVSVPIRYGERVLGVLSLESPRRGAFSRDDVRLLESFANHLAVTLETARLFAEMKRLAITDPSTGLYNYRHLQDRLVQEVSRAMRHGRYLSVVMLDLDDFKEVNDRFGHAFGDFVLREFAAFLRASIRTEDDVFRYGGDEFTLLLADTCGPEAVELLSRLAAEASSRRFANDRGEVSGVRFRAGVAVLPDDGCDAATLLHHADVALYRAKRSEDLRVACYSEARQ